MCQGGALITVSVILQKKSYGIDVFCYSVDLVIKIKSFYIVFYFLYLRMGQMLRISSGALQDMC